MIIRYNLFQPLGWRPHIPPPQYQLIGTSVADDIKNIEAFIHDRTTKRLHIVGVGEKIGEDTVVKVIEEKRVVILEKGSKETVLAMGRMLFY